MASCRVYNRGQLWPGGAVAVEFEHHFAPSNIPLHVKKRLESRVLNVHPFVARLIIGNMATLNELQTIYSLDDMRIMNEILNLKEESEYLAHQISKDN